MNIFTKNDIKATGFINITAIAFQCILLVLNYYKIDSRETYASVLFIMSNIMLIIFHFSLLKHRVPNVKDWAVFVVGYSVNITDIIGKNRAWDRYDSMREEMVTWLEENEVRHVANEKYHNEIVLFSKSDATFLKLSLQESSQEI